MEVGWLRCESVERGMFSDEKVVVVQRSNGKTEAFFVPSREVHGDTVRIEYAASGALLWATLPTAQPVTIAVLPSKVAA